MIQNRLELTPSSPLHLGSADLKRVAADLPNLHHVGLFWQCFLIFGRPFEQFLELLSNSSPDFIDFIRKCLYNKRHFNRHPPRLPRPSPPES